MEKTAILFVHGFMGCKRQFLSLQNALEDCGADMILHVLPGHDSTLEEFRTTDAGIWQQSVNDAVHNLAKEYDRILLVGHSMGGLLAIRAAIAEPDKVCGVAAIGFPIKIRLRHQWLALNIDASHPAKEGEDPRITAARTMSGVKIESAGQYFSTFPQNMQFLKMTRLARREIHLLKAPLTVLNFEKDEIVAPSVPDFVHSQLPDARVIMMPNSFHFLFTDDELQLMASEIRGMLQQ
ncbi:MAG: alpha/beta fold hydrolase [Clostridiales bacterium]|jgi:carboxylesterase|nr:alpha/beta fold hydrolase [Clostridiales bacterium]